MKVFDHHLDGENYLDTVHVQYHNIAQEMKQCVEELIDGNMIIPEDVNKTQLVLRGDRDQGAFRLCFRTVINLKNKKKPIEKIKAVAEVYSAKEKDVVLEIAIIPWLR